MKQDPVLILQLFCSQYLSPSDIFVPKSEMTLKGLSVSDNRRDQSKYDLIAAHYP